MWDAILRKIEDIFSRLARLEALETSRVIPVKTTTNQSFCRILDDNVVRAALYANAAAQVTGVTDVLGSGYVMPAKITGVWIKVTLIATAIGAASIVVKNPGDAGNPNGLSGYAGVAGNLVTGLVFVTLNSSGQFYFQLQQGMNRTVWDVVAYVV